MNRKWNISMLLCCGVLLFSMATRVSAQECSTTDSDAFESCITTGVSSCATLYPSCDSSALVSTVSEIVSNVQTVCCQADNRRNCLIFERNNFAGPRKGRPLPPAFRLALKAGIQNLIRDGLQCE